ncbi:MAG: DUF2156 domain-containing protein [Promethearchaeota archaeon]
MASHMQLQLPKEFSLLLLSDRSRLEPILSSADYRISEYSFTNLYMWRNYYKLRWAIIDDIFFLVAEVNRNNTDKFYAFPPICLNKSEWATALNYLHTWSQTNGLLLFLNRVPDAVVAVVEKFKEMAQNDGNPQIQIQIQPDRDNWDYVYLRTDLSDLPGKAYANFRKTKNYFKKSNSWQYEPIVPAIREQILQLQTEWCDMHACEESESLYQEDQAIHEILPHWDTLNLLGGTLFVENRIVAFTVAEKLSPNTIVIHAEKADPSFRGVYECLVQEFSSSLPENITFINREQDLGQEKLRQAKERYHPHHMVQKSIIEIEN